MADLRTNLCGVTLKNPVMTASGTFGSGMEYGEFVDLNQLGAVVNRVVGLNLKDAHMIRILGEQVAVCIIYIKGNIPAASHLLDLGTARLLVGINVAGDKP